MNRKFNSLYNIFSDSNLIVLFFLILYTILVRLLTLKMIGTGGDEIWYWFSAKKLFYGFPYNSWDHVTARYGVIIPIYLIQKIFGVHPVVYYFTPFLISILITIFVYNIGLLIHNRKAAFLACILLILFPKMIFPGDENLPDIFSAFYIILSLYFIIKYLKSSNHRFKLLLIISAIIFFLAYSSKITNLFFLPGFLIFIWMSNKKFSDVFIYMLVLFVLFLFESFFFYFTIHNFFGSLDLIINTHIIGNRSLKNMNFWSLFNRYSVLGWYWKFTFVLYFISTIYIFLFSKNKYIKHLATISFSFLLIITFSIKDINPITPALPFRDRYLLACIPIIMLVISSFIIMFINSFIKRIQLFFNDFIEENKNKTFFIIINSYFNFFKKRFLFTYFVITILFSIYTVVKKYPIIFNYPIKLVYEYHNILNYSYQNGIPIISEKKNDRDKALFTCNCVFLDDRLKDKNLFYLDKESWKPYKALSFYSSEDIIINNKEISYIIADKYKNHIENKRILFDNPKQDVIVALRGPFSLISMKLEDFLNKIE